MTVHQLSQTDARRIAVQAQLLAEPRPTALLDVIRHLTMLQIDPTAAIAPSADLMLWSRLGSSYQRDELTAALQDHLLIEIRGIIRPAEDIALYRAEMAVWPGVGQLRDWQYRLRDWVETNDECRRDILSLLSSSGPLTSRELPDTCDVPWTSTGWTNNQNVIKLLDLMLQRGEVAIAGRRGRERLWDLASRVYPDDPVVPLEEAEHISNELRLQALGLARPTNPASSMEPTKVGEVGESAVVEGVKGTWRVDPSYLGQPFEGRAALLSPFDRLIYDRRRTLDLFDFDYVLEMYKPAAQRMWGYFALPILYGDRLVGKLDAAADRKAAVLRVNAIHEDVPFTKAIAAAVDHEIDDLARWLELELEFDLSPG